MIAASLLMASASRPSSGAETAKARKLTSEESESTVARFSEVASRWVSAWSIAPLLGLLAEATDNETAIIAAAVVGLLALPCYLPALRAERRRGDTVVG